MIHSKTFLVGLNPYRVSLHEEPGDHFTLIFDCYAEDCDHAIEQAENAYPGCVIKHCALSDFRSIVH